ncbi:hypothetical protein BJ322DRAFT_765163 [Thelephora terrestris]|uniref:Uncharacterized protein n=1 Tax=Thelephora terrestris TaxID=56493 RepID=A0A9P6HHF7_9AGAM|nr:hypothetical protein BJ322DRAFT_765163 [Thelephora terrestris]
MSDDGSEPLTENSDHDENERLAKDILRDDLTRVLRYGFNFQGTFAFSVPLPYSPNPCLHIDGIGIVGLPLSDRDANLIANTGASTREGAADTVFVDRSRISYKNPKWETYVGEVVHEHVWKRLGCAPYKTAPRYELRELLLQKPGSRADFFSSADARTTPETFGTVIIVLPSGFTGGEIRASHGDRNLTLVSAKGSLYETTLLAWYTDVKYEVENLTSGYRLALVYNLVHTSAETPTPCIPSAETLVCHTRDVFRKWLLSGYKGIPDDHVAAYVLEGNDRMKDDDVLSVLKAAADAENMVLLLGTLCAHVTGWAEASTADKPTYGLSQGTFENPIMTQLHVVKFKVKKLTDIRGKPAQNGFGLLLDEGNLVPEFPFRDVEPDEQDIHPFTSYTAKPLEYWYRRRALVLFPSSKQLDVLLSSGGVEYALSELEKSASEGPTEENQKIVEFIFQNWRKTSSPEDCIFDFRPSYEVPTMTPNDIATRLAGIAVQSNDAKLWTRTMSMCKFRDEVDLSRFGLEHVVAGWEKFQLEDIEAALDRIVDGLRSVQDTLMVLKALRGSENVLHPEARRDQWLSGHLDRSFSKKADESSLRLIMEVACSKGLDYISRVIMPPLLAQPLEVTGWAKVAESLYGSQDQLLALPPSQSQTLSNAELFDSILDDVRSMIPKGGTTFLLADSPQDSEDDDSERAAQESGNLLDR